MILLKDIQRYRSKNAYTGRTRDGNQVFISYNTLIAVKYYSITFLTSRNYSTTTAHHKTDAIRYFNSCKTIEVNPEALEAIGNDSLTTAKEAIKEQEEKNQLLKELKNNKTGNTTIDLNVKRIIKPAGLPETKHYKNGNKDTVYKYRTNWKHIKNISYEKVIKHKPQIINKGSKGKFKTFQVTARIQKIREL